MSAIVQLLLLVRRDLRIERKSSEVLLNTTLFGVLVVVIASLAFYTDPASAPKLASGVLWLSLVFSGMLAMLRVWAKEREWNAFLALWLSSVPRPAIYLAKMISTVLFMCAMEVVLIPLVALFFHLELDARLAALALCVFLGIVGYAAVGTLFAAMSVRTRARELTLSLALFPLTAPALIAGVVATRGLFVDAPTAELMQWIRVLLAFDLVFVTASALLFEPLLSD